jgi:hypothetical protein
VTVEIQVNRVGKPTRRGGAELSETITIEVSGDARNGAPDDMKN